MDKIAIKLYQLTKRMVTENKLCLFSTIGLEKFPRSRYVGSFILEKGFRVSLVCVSDSNKVAEIAKNSRSQVLFFNRDSSRVVTLTGHARIEKNMKARKKIYDATAPLKIFRTFDERFGVIRFVPFRLEYLNVNVGNNSIVVDLSKGIRT